MGTATTHATADGQILRPLGAFETMIDLYVRRNPVQFTLVLEFARSVSGADLTQALSALQKAHPLLNTRIQRQEVPDHSDATAVFRFSGLPIPVRIADRSTWQQEAAAEQTTPLPSTPGPLVRSVLVRGRQGGAGSTILLTFSHQIADGRGAVAAAADLARSLAGADLTARAVPRAQEDLFDEDGDEGSMSDGMPDGTSGSGQVLKPGRLRAFDGATPVLQPEALDADTTTRLIGRAREERCTVQAALCAAAAIALNARSGRSDIKINVPVDLRPALGDSDDVAIRFTGTLISLTVVPDAPFWALARRAGEQLHTARRPETLRAAALGLAAMAPTTADTAEQAMLAATTADIEITNLGVADIDASVSALWGPTMTTQVQGEQILGVVTHSGVLRMVTTTHSPLDGLTQHIGQLLTDHCRETTVLAEASPLA